MLVMRRDHGVAEKGVSAYPQEGRGAGNDDRTVRRKRETIEVNRPMKKVPKDSRMGCCTLGGVSLSRAGGVDPDGPFPVTVASLKSKGCPFN